jgi:hypothetical protein
MEPVAAVWGLSLQNGNGDGAKGSRGSRGAGGRINVMGLFPAVLLLPWLGASSHSFGTDTPEEEEK